MFSTLRDIIDENWRWRCQVGNLALFELKKTCRGTILGWAWLFIKPLLYISVFWFALELGLRAGESGGEYPYIVWLSAGLIPWFFMQNMINTGSNVYKKYPFLVKRIHFPLSAISTFYVISQFIVFLALMALLLVVCLAMGVKLTVQVIQLVPIALLMLLFFTFFSILTSPISAVSKDFSNLLRALSTPLFWVSGIIFDVSGLPYAWLHVILAFNPVTFFAGATRMALCEGSWLWEKPEMLVPFLIVFVLTVLFAVLCYGRLRKDVADVL